MLFRPSTHLMRPTHIREDDLIYSVYRFKCQSKTPLRTPPGTLLDQVSVRTQGSVELTCKINPHGPLTYKAAPSASLAALRARLISQVCRRWLQSLEMPAISSLRIQRTSRLMNTTSICEVLIRTIMERCSGQMWHVNITGKFKTSEAILLRHTWRGEKISFQFSYIPVLIRKNKSCIDVSFSSTPNTSISESPAAVGYLTRI